MRLIDADFLYDEAFDRLREGEVLYGFSCADIDNAPTVEAEPVCRGRWIPGEAKCPICGENKFAGLDADIWADWQPKRCPNCGAKMAKGSEVTS